MYARMKRILLSLLAVLALSGARAADIRGEKSFGPKIGYFSHNKSAVAGFTFSYAFSNHFRLVPEVGCVFRHHNQDAFMADLNVHLPFSFENGGAVALYPLAGLTLNSWGTHFRMEELEKDVTSHITRLGANLGAGFDLRCSETMRINIEAKYSLVKSYSSLVVTAGISYIF